MPTDIDEAGTLPNSEGLPPNVLVMCERFDIPPGRLSYLPQALHTLIMWCSENERQFQRKRKLTYKRANLWHLWEAIGCTCYLCGKHTTFDKLTTDHVFPKSAGYGLMGNVMPACEDCNSDRGNDPLSIKQIEKVCEVYESIGRVFDPRMVLDRCDIEMREVLDFTPESEAMTL
jgi:hypothetical protein